MAEFKFNLGDEVQDIITKFKGIVMCRHEWFNGCMRYSVQARTMAKDGGKTPDLEAYDEQQLVLVKAGRVKPILSEKVTGPVAAPRPGGPRNEPRSAVSKHG